MEDEVEVPAGAMVMVLEEDVDALVMKDMTVGVVRCEIAPRCFNIVF